MSTYPGSHNGGPDEVGYLPMVIVSVLTVVTILITELVI